MILKSRLLAIAFFLAPALATPSLQAQEIRAQFLEPVVTSPVKLETAVRESIGAFTSIANTTFKPAGPGPFPAVVVMHTCGGIKDAHIRQHSQEQSAGFANSSHRFAATVANYGTCRYQDRYSFVLKDIDRPLLMLMGSKDAEFPAAPCFPLLEEIKAGGKPVSWHLFADATHSWDKPSQPARGFQFNEFVAQDATARMLAFLKGN